MQYSKLFGKTQRDVSKQYEAVSHELLIKAGFIRESTAGRYYFLPLGQLVQNKIIAIIRKEMNKAGAQEMVTPVLHPISLWKETNRDKETGFELMTIKDRREAIFALGGTAEEMMVDLVRKFQISYKDLPFNIYQFSTKFRDELRARGGLLRVREFTMKDAYSFHVDEADFNKEYKNMWNTYTKIFNRMNLKTIVVESDNGYIGGDYCHEFVVESEIGESAYLVSPDNLKAVHEEIASEEEKKNYSKKRGIEVGNIFQLGLHYSNKMKNAFFVDKDGKEKPYYMGCYGIGIGRTMAAAVELFHDEKGIIWPESIAPYQVYLIGLDLKDIAIKEKAFKVYKYLQKQNIEVLFDDRENVSAGEKFSDCDLIGIPHRLVMSRRTGEKVEVKSRNKSESEIVELGIAANNIISK